MKSPFLLFTSIMLSGMFVFCACEGSSHDDNHDDCLDYEDRPSSITDSVQGNWSGISSSHQALTKLQLHENKGSISGSLIWPGPDRRSVSGSQKGSSIVLCISGGDLWTLQISGDSMHGTGIKASTGKGYPLSFTRKN